MTKGFTLIETLVAITILMIVVIGPLGLLAKAIVDAHYAANQITGYYLAQEGLESVINYRDQDRLAIKNGTIDNSTWLSGLENCFFPQVCQIDAPSLQVVPFDPANPKMKLVANRALLYMYPGDATALSPTVYSYGPAATGGTDTIFSRQIQITKMTCAVPMTPLNCTPDQSDLTQMAVRVTSQMTWTNGVTPRSFVLSTIIFR